MTEKSQAEILAIIDELLFVLDFWSTRSSVEPFLGDVVRAENKLNKIKQRILEER